MPLPRDRALYPSRMHLGARAPPHTPPTLSLAQLGLSVQKSGLPEAHSSPSCRSVSPPSPWEEGAGPGGANPLRPQPGGPPPAGPAAQDGERGPNALDLPHDASPWGTALADHPPTPAPRRGTLGRLSPVPAGHEPPPRWGPHTHADPQPLQRRPGRLGRGTTWSLGRMPGSLLGSPGRSARRRLTTQTHPALSA